MGAAARRPADVGSPQHLSPGASPGTPSGPDTSAPWRAARAGSLESAHGPLTVRTIEASEIDSWVRCMGVGFLFTVADGYGQYFLGDIDLERTWGAFDDGRVVGTLRSFATPFTAPGPAETSVAALTNVTVAPTHRRRGLLTKMITSELRATVDRGEPVGILIASEYPIYGRFGYGAAIEAATYSVDLATTRFRHSPDGSTELVDLGTLRREAPRALRALPRRTDRLHRLQ